MDKKIIIVVVCSLLIILFAPLVASYKQDPSTVSGGPNATHQYIPKEAELK